MGDYFYGCSDCPERTTKVKIDYKDKFHDLLPYCDLKMRFLSKKEVEHNAICKEAFETLNDDLGGVPVIGEDANGNPITTEAQ
jgi:hypothetical protein